MINYDYHEVLPLNLRTEDAPSLWNMSPASIFGESNDLFVFGVGILVSPKVDGPKRMGDRNLVCVLASGDDTELEPRAFMGNTLRDCLSVACKVRAARMFISSRGEDSFS